MKDRINKKRYFELFSLLLLLLLVMGLSGCKKNNGKSDNDINKSEEKNDDTYVSEKDEPTGKDTEKYIPEEDKYLLYIKDREIQSYSLKDNKVRRISSGFGSDKLNSELNEVIAWTGQDLSTLFYWGKDASGTYSENKDGGSIKIDEDSRKIDNSRINDEGTLLTYRKEDGSLNQWDSRSKKNDVLGSGCYVDDDYGEGYILSNDGEDVLYLYKEEQTFVLSLKKRGEEERIIYRGNIKEYHASEDLSKVVFKERENGSGIYLWENGKGLVKLNADVPDGSHLVKVCNDGGIYLWYGLEDIQSDLYYFNGDETILLAENVDKGSFNYSSGWDYYVSSKDYLLFHTIDKDGSGGWYISNSGNKKLLSIKNDSLKLDYNSTKDNAFFFEPYDKQDGFGVFYRIKIDDTGSIKLERIAENVKYEYFVCSIEGEDVLYYKSGREENTYDLYINEKMIKTVTGGVLYAYDSNRKKSFFITRENQEVKTMTLWEYSDGMLKMIDDGLFYDVYLTRGGNLMYLKDYDETKSLGSLYYYDGKIRKLDDDVISLVHPITLDDSMDRYINYGYKWQTVRFKRMTEDTSEPLEVIPPVPTPKLADTQIPSPTDKPSTPTFTPTEEPSTPTPIETVLKEVPYVLGLSVEDAEKTLKAVSPYFSIIWTEEEYSDEYEKGTISVQYPNGGSTVVANATIKLTLSAGSEMKGLFDVRGFDMYRAKELLETLGYVPVMKEEHSDTYPEGTVIRTDPGAGMLLERGSEVICYVSIGSESTMVEVPNLIGMNQSRAEKMITNSKLCVGDITFEYSDAFDAGIVINQGCDTGDFVVAGTEIDLIISLGELPEP